MKLKQIHKDCQKKLSVAAVETTSDANDIIQASYYQYYSGGIPEIYDRSFTLPGATLINGPSINGDKVSLEAGYESKQISYSTGTPGFPVFQATAEGFGGIVGDSSYDEEALHQIVEAAKNNFNEQFK